MINTKWVLKVKYKDDGSVDRFKAWLVANRMRQIQGSDYEDTFSPVIQPLSIRLVLSLAIMNGWKIHQLDVSNAFLHSVLDEWIIVAQPYGFQDSRKPDHICELKKAL